MASQGAFLSQQPAFPKLYRHNTLRMATSDWPRRWIYSLYGNCNSRNHGIKVNSSKFEVINSQHTILVPSSQLEGTVYVKITFIRSYIRYVRVNYYLASCFILLRHIRSGVKWCKVVWRNINIHTNSYISYLWLTSMAAVSGAQRQGIPRISWSFLNASKIFYDQSYLWLGPTAAVTGA